MAFVLKLRYPPALCTLDGVFKHHSKTTKLLFKGRRYHLQTCLGWVTDDDNSLPHQQTIWRH